MGIMQMNIYLQIMTALFWILMGYFCSYTARQKGRDPFIWFFIGLFCGIFGILAIILLPAIKPEEKPPQPVAPPAPIIFWYYLDGDHNQVGPVGSDQLQDALARGVINENTYVWCEGMENWGRLKDTPIGNK